MSTPTPSTNPSPSPARSLSTTPAPSTSSEPAPSQRPTTLTTHRAKISKVNKNITKQKNRNRQLKRERAEDYDTPAQKHVDKALKWEEEKLLRLELELVNAEQELEDFMAKERGMRVAEGARSGSEDGKCRRTKEALRKIFRGIGS